VPPRGSGTYSPVNFRNSYDPSLAEEYQARQERANAARLAQMAEQGQITGEGIKGIGQTWAGAIDKGFEGYQRGKQMTQEREAHEARMKMAEAEMAKGKAEDDYWNAPVSSDLGAPTRRQKKFDLELQKTEEEVNKLKRVPATSQTAQWDYTGKETEDGRPILYNRITGEEKALNTKSKVKEDKPPKSPGEDQLDKEFAKDLNEYESGGRPALEKNLALLEKAKGELAGMVASKKDPRGVMGMGKRSTSRLADELKDENAVRIRNDVRAAAQGAMKAALGASFTEREGERIMNAAYDENLSPAENLKKIDLAINEVLSKKGSMETRAKHFRSAGGTLKGFAGGDSPVVSAPPPVVQPPPGGDGVALAAPAAKTETRRQYSPSRRTTRVFYADGSYKDIPDAAP
jgi:hypothetical protein